MNIICITTSMNDVTLSYGISKEDSKYKLFITSTEKDKDDMSSLIKMYCDREIYITKNNETNFIYIPEGKREEVSINDNYCALKRVGESVVMETSTFGVISNIKVEGFAFSEIPF